MRRTLAICLLTLLPTAGLAGPEYPFPLPEWYSKQDRVLRTRKVTLDFTETPLPQVMQFLSQISGVKVYAAGKDLDPATKRVTMNIRQLRLGSALQLICAFHGLQVRHSKEGVVLTNAPDRFPAPQHARIRTRIETARQRALAPARALRPDPNEKLLAALKRRVNYDFTDTPLADVVQFLREVTQVNMMLDPATARGNHVVTAKSTGIAIDKGLALILAPLGLGWAPRNGVIYVTQADRAKKMKLAADRRRRVEKARARKVAALWKKAIPEELEGKAIHELPGLLTKALMVPIYTGPGAWAVTGKIDASTAGKSLKEVAETLKKQGVLVVVESGAIFLIKGK